MNLSTSGAEVGVHVSAHAFVLCSQVSCKRRAERKVRRAKEGRAALQIFGVHEGDLAAILLAISCSFHAAAPYNKTIEHI